MDLRKMRELFVVLEQQRVSRDAVENLGPPSQEKLENLMRERSVDYKQVKQNQQRPKK